MYSEYDSYDRDAIDKCAVVASHPSKHELVNFSPSSVLRTTYLPEQILRADEKDVPIVQYQVLIPGTTVPGTVPVRCTVDGLPLSSQRSVRSSCGE